MSILLEKWGEKTNNTHKWYMKPRWDRYETRFADVSNSKCKFPVQRLGAKRFSEVGTRTYGAHMFPRITRLCRTSWSNCRYLAYSSRPDGGYLAISDQLHQSNTDIWEERLVKWVNPIEYARLPLNKNRQIVLSNNDHDVITAILCLSPAVRSFRRISQEFTFL